MRVAHVERLPGGVEIISGGTRKGSVKLNRPWQTALPYSKETCPFEPDKLGVRKVYRKIEHWLELENLFTPHTFSRLIIPDTCWESGQLYSLGGVEEITNALQLAFETMKNEPDRKEFWMGCHIGYLAGQNLGHLHWHLLEPPPRQSPVNRVEEFKDLTSSPFVLWSESGSRVVVGGHRAGQCFIFGNSLTFDQQTISISTNLTRLIRLGEIKFRSSQNLPPEFMIGLRFQFQKVSSSIEFDYGWYLPILNHWGFNDYFALLENRPIAHPWTLEDTFEHLSSP